MSLLLKVGTGGLLLGLAALAWRTGLSHSSDPRVEIKSVPPEASPLCPWREPESDLHQFFPSATRYEVETRILSGLRAELGLGLGRTPSGDENALRWYRVWQDTTDLGWILTRRVKGENGAIELVLAVDTRQRICAARLQRLREPEPVARALEGPDWLGAFVGKSADSAWKMGIDLPPVPEAVRPSAEAVVEGARSLLVLLAIANRAGTSSPVVNHH